MDCYFHDVMQSQWTEFANRLNSSNWGIMDQISAILKRLLNYRLIGSKFAHSKVISWLIGICQLNFEMRIGFLFAKSIANSLSLSPSLQINGCRGIWPALRTRKKCPMSYEIAFLRRLYRFEPQLSLCGLLFIKSNTYWFWPKLNLRPSDCKVI